MDRVTDSIAHFVGAFELAVEETRSREAYDAFKAAVSPDEVLAPLKFKGLWMDPAYEIEDLDPKVDHQPLPPPAPTVDVAQYPIPDFETPPVELDVSKAPTPPRELDDGPAPAEGPPLVSSLDLPPPSSVAGIHQLVNRLEDADWVGTSDHQTAGWAAAYEQQLEQLSEMAEALSPIVAPITALAEAVLDAIDWVGLSESMVATATEPPSEVVESHVFLNDEVEGIHVDGALADTLPDWLTLRPEYLQQRDEEAEKAEEAETQPDQTNVSIDPVGETVSTSEMAFSVVTGGNTLVNEVSINSNWLDAPYIVVEGSAHNFDAVSQINLLFDRDSGSPEFEASTAPSMARNAAEITTESYVAPKDDIGKAGADQQDSGPVGWALVRIEGDLTQINTLQQYNFANDADHSSIEFGSNSLTLGLGENQLENLALLNQFGWEFDLIIVGGDMIDMNIVRQINLLVDDDTIGTMQYAAETSAWETISPAATGGAQPVAGEQVGMAQSEADQPLDEPVGSLLVSQAEVPTSEQAGTSATVQADPSTSEQTSTVGTELTKSALIETVEQTGTAIGGSASQGSGLSKSVEKASSSTKPVKDSAPTQSANASPTPAAEKATPMSQQAGPSTIEQTGTAIGSSASQSNGPAPSVEKASAIAKPVKDSAPAQPAKEPSDDEPLTSTVEKTAPVAQPVATATTAPENLLYNEAKIHTRGEDVAAELPAQLAKTSAALLDGAKAIEQAALDLDIFDGTDLLRVLLIEGDFTTVNWIDQFNVLGDSDELLLLHNRLAAQAGAEVTTGSNALANIASITDLGVNSQIMAANEVVDAAFLHQAGLIDDTAPPEGVARADLASEAVAFLADGMIEAEDALADAALAAADAGLAAVNASQADLMQTMLS